MSNSVSFECESIPNGCGHFMVMHGMFQTKICSMYGYWKPFPRNSNNFMNALANGVHNWKYVGQCIINFKKKSHSMNIYCNITADII